MTPGHQKQRLTMASHLPTDVFPDTRASSHTLVVPETSTAIGSCRRWGLPPSCSSHSMAIAIYVDYACDTINSTSTTSPDGVITMFRRLGTLKTYRSAGSWVPPKRPLSVSWLPVAFQYSSTSPNFWNIWPPIPTPLWQATQPRLMKCSRPAGAVGRNAGGSPRSTAPTGAG